MLKAVAQRCFVKSMFWNFWIFYKKIPARNYFAVKLLNYACKFNKNEPHDSLMHFSVFFQSFYCTKLLWTADFEMRQMSTS